MGLADNNLCCYCGEVETQIHVVESCPRADQVWGMVKQYEAYEETETGAGYWCGLGGGDLELKMECLWHLLNNKELNAMEIFVRSTTFIENMTRFKENGQGDIDISKILN